MDAKKKLIMLLDYAGLKIAPFASKVGQVAQTFYDIKAGKIKSFTPDVSQKITKAYPEINFNWLTIGEGEMVNKLSEKPESTVNRDIKATIKELRRRRKFKNQEEVAEFLNYNPSYFSRAINSDEIPIDLEDAFFKAFPKSEYLVSGDIFPPISAEPEKIDNTHLAQDIINRKRPQGISNVRTVPTENYMMVEYQDLATAAGVMGSVGIEDLPEMKKRLVPVEYDSGKYLVVSVHGDSMDDGSKYSIPSGSEILIKEYVLDNGDILPIRNNLFVIVTREGVVFKQVIKHVPGEYIRLHSYNDKYEDYDVAMEDVLQIFIYRKIVSNRPEVKPI